MSTAPLAKESTIQASTTTYSSGVLSERGPILNSKTGSKASLAGESEDRGIEMAKPELPSRRGRSLSTTSNSAGKGSNGIEVTSATVLEKENSAPSPRNGLDHSFTQSEVNHRIAGRPTCELSSRELPKFRKTKSEKSTSAPTKSSQPSIKQPPPPVYSAPGTDPTHTTKISSVNVDHKRGAVSSAPPARPSESSSRRTVQSSTARSQSKTISRRGVPSNAVSDVHLSSSDNVLRRQSVFPPAQSQRKWSNATSGATPHDPAPRHKESSSRSPASQTISPASTSSRRPSAQSSSRHDVPSGNYSRVRPSLANAGTRASLMPPAQSRINRDKRSPHPQHSIRRPNEARNAPSPNTPARQLPKTTPTGRQTPLLLTRDSPKLDPTTQLPATASKSTSSTKAGIATPAFQQKPFEVTQYHRMTAKDFPKFKKAKLDTESSARGTRDTTVSANRLEPDTSDIRKPIAGSSEPPPQVGFKRPREDDDDGIERIYCPWILDSGEYCSKEHHTGKGLIAHIMYEHFEKVDGIEKTECRYDGCGAMVRNLRQHLQTMKGHSGLAHLLGLKH